MCEWKLNRLLLFALLGALAASVGIGVAAPQALAAPSTATLEVNENCVEAAWPCWTAEGSASRPQPTLSMTIASGGTVTFVDRGREANLAWTGASAKCEPSVPVAPTPPKTGWEGKCTFEKSGIYRFESSTLFDDGYNNYRKYEIAVEGIPTDETASASGETQTEATLNGNIDPEGNTVEYHFEYEGPGLTGKTSTPTATLTAADFTSHPVSAQATGLEPGMTYRFQLVATYGAGKTAVSGATLQTFATSAVTAPTATTLAAEALKETEATLKGTVVPGGEATEYFFEYGTGLGYGQTTQKATLPASGNQTVSATLVELTPGTEYHFRLVAKNKSGSVQGKDLTFVTASTPPTKPSPTPTPNPIPILALVPGPISPEPEIAPPVPALVEGSLKLTASRRGSSLRGSVGIGTSGAGSRLEIEVLAKPSALGERGSKLLSVARLVRGSVSSGSVAFSLALSGRAERTLHRRHRLAVTVKLTLVAPGGAASTTMRRLVLRA